MARKIIVTQTKSMIGRPEKHRKILRALGLGKIRRSVEFTDSPTIRGMIRHVSHLVKTEEKK